VQFHLPISATKGATGLPGFTWKMAVKTGYVCVSVCVSTCVWVCVCVIIPWAIEYIPQHSWGSGISNWANWWVADWLGGLSFSNTFCSSNISGTATNRKL